MATNDVLQETYEDATVASFINSYFEWVSLTYQNLSQFAVIPLWLFYTKNIASFSIHHGLLSIRLIWVLLYVIALSNMLKLLSNVPMLELEQKKKNNKMKRWDNMKDNEHVVEVKYKTSSSLS